MIRDQRRSGKLPKGAQDGLPDRLALFDLAVGFYPLLPRLARKYVGWETVGCVSATSPLTSPPLADLLLEV
jgi:hypothetical protein